MLGNAFLLAFRQIRRNPLRSLLTVLGIVIGVAAVITMVTVGNGATEAVKEQIESFGSNQLMLRKGQRMGPGGAAGAPSFKLEDVEALEDQIAGVLSAAPQSQRSTIVVANGKNWTTTIIGSSSDYFTTDNRTLAEGRFFEPAEEMSGAAVCVIGTTIQKELFGPGAPVIGEIAFSGEEPASGWTNESRTYRFTLTDATSGIDKDTIVITGPEDIPEGQMSAQDTLEEIEEGVWQFEAPVNGTYTVDVKDMAGNAAESKTIDVTNIDKVNPK